MPGITPSETQCCVLIAAYCRSINYTDYIHYLWTAGLPDICGKQLPAQKQLAQIFFTDKTGLLPGPATYTK